MGWYSTNAGRKLKGKLEDLAAMGPDERHSLAEEIDVTRMLAERSLLIFEKTVLDPQTEVSAELKATATCQLRESLKDVSEIVTKAAVVRARLESVVGVEDIGYIVHQIKRVAFELLDEQTCNAFTAQLDEIRLPKRGGSHDEESVREMLAEMNAVTSGADEEVDATPEA